MTQTLKPAPLPRPWPAAEQMVRFRASMERQAGDFSRLGNQPLTILKRLKKLLGVTLAVTAFGSLAAQAQPFDDGARVLGENVNISCKQPSLTAVDCDYRIVRPQTVVDVRAQFGEIELPRPDFYPYPIPGSSVSVVFFLIDTSDPRRSSAVRAAVRHLRQILVHAKEHHVFGLGTFDKHLRVLVKPGGSAADVEAALANVRAQGRTTELYRNTLAAVNLVGEFDASRRSVVIFSDGQAEDRAYFHADVVNAARRYGVSIDGLGYPRSVALSVPLQTLRRMAEETGGQFVEGSPRFDLPKPYLDAPFNAFDNGGVLAIDLTPAVDAGAADDGMVELTWQLANGSARARVDVKLPAPPPPPAPAPMVEEPVTAPLKESVAGAKPTTVAPQTSVGAVTADSTRLDASEGAPGGGLAAASRTAETETGSKDAVPPSPIPSQAIGIGDGSSQQGTAANPIPNAGAPGNTTASQAVTSAAPGTQKDGAPAPTIEKPTTTVPKPAGSGAAANILLPLNNPLMYVAMALGVVLIILTLVLVRVLRKRRSSSQSLDSEHLTISDDDVTEQMQVFAFLQAMDSTEKLFPITTAAFRIGRHADNELPFADPSMSRYHAQIQLLRDGSFQINDLDSMNGLFVNDQRVSTAIIKNADIVEFGDVRMRFGIAQGEDALGGDETVMVATSLPAPMSRQERGAA